MSREPMVLVTALTHRYGDVVALDSVDLDVRAEEIAVIAGPSGSGKSTLLRLIAGLEPVQEGTIVVNRHDLSLQGARGGRRMRRYEVVFMFAEPSRNLLLGASVDTNIGRLARWRHDRVDPASLLTRFGLAGRGRSRITDLSGGEQQRLAVALASLGDAKVVIADEPTAELDHENSVAVLAALSGLAAMGKTVVVASHDQAVIAAAQRLVTLHEGAVLSCS